MHSELKNRIPFTIKKSQKNMKITIEKKQKRTCRFNQFLSCDINIK